MAAQNQKKGLVLVDFINEIVDRKGKLAGKGYADFIEKNRTLDRVQTLLSKAREHGIQIFHVKVGFSHEYIEHPQSSVLFGAAKKFEALQLNSWATEFHPKAEPKPNETIIIKHRVSAFYGTPLDLILRNNNITELLVCGVATDIAVQSIVRDAHDRDYSVTVVSDCCVAANDDDHEQSLRTLTKIGIVKNLNQLELM